MALGGVVAAVVAAGCTPEPTERHGETSLSLAAKQDIAAVIKASPRGIPNALDMSNPLHYRFFVQQLAAAGYSRERYPELYAVTERARLAPPKVARTPRAEVADTDTIVPIQTLTGFGSLDGIHYEASAVSSVPDDPVYSLLIVQVYDLDENPLGPATAVDTATAVASDLDAVALGTSQTPGAPTQAIATYFWEDASGDVFSGEIVAEAGVVPSSILNLAPMPKPGQTITTLCLARSGADCTYDPAGGTEHNVLMPIAGAVVFPLPIMNTATKTASITLLNPDPDDGGGCRLLKTSGDFFADPNTKINGNTISWNLAPAHFNGDARGCLPNNSPSIFTLMLQLTVGTRPALVTITSNQDGEPPNEGGYLRIPPLQVRFSCIAEGTEVVLAGGAPVKIEDLVSGQAVAVDRLGTVEQVTGKLRGMERVPMVRLKTRGGHDLLLTEGHPVITPDRGPVLARELMVGATVVAIDGPDTLVSVTRERSDRPVWNLNIGTPPSSTEAASATGRTFFAGGIQVGDNIMQYVENRKHQLTEAAAAAPPISPRWRTDYRSSIEAAQRTGHRPAP